MQSGQLTRVVAESDSHNTSVGSVEHLASHLPANQKSRHASGGRYSVLGITDALRNVSDPADVNVRHTGDLSDVLSLRCLLWLHPVMKAW